MKSKSFESKVGKGIYKIKQQKYWNFLICENANQLSMAWHPKFLIQKVTEDNTNIPKM